MSLGPVLEIGAGSNALCPLALCIETAEHRSRMNREFTYGSGAPEVRVLRATRQTPAVRCWPANGRNRRISPLRRIPAIVSFLSRHSALSAEPPKVTV